MSRWVVPAKRGLINKNNGIGTSNTDGAGSEGDGNLARIAKYIPGEILAAYTALFTGLVTFNLLPAQTTYAAIVLIAVFLVVTIVYIYLNAPAGKQRRAHLIVAPFAFLAWSYPISSALLADFFVPLIAFGGQVIVIAMSIFIKPLD